MGCVLCDLTRMGGAPGDSALIAGRQISAGNEAVKTLALQLLCNGWERLIQALYIARNICSITH